MKKLLTLAIAAFASVASATDYVGTVKNLYVKDNGMVLISAENANGSLPTCNTSTNEHWPFYFVIDNEAKAKMFDMLLEAKSANTTLYIGHEESADSRCKVSYVAVID